MPKLDKEQHEAFCQHYAISHNATKAAKSAGYAEGSAYNQGYILLKRPEVQDRIAELEGEVVTNIDVIDELEKQYEHAKINGHGQTALKALELLARARGNKIDDGSDLDLDSLEDNIVGILRMLGKDTAFQFIIKAFPEEFNEEEKEQDDE